MIEVIKSPTPVTEKTQWTVFLAGPMNGAPSWQSHAPKVAAQLGIENLTMLNPRKTERFVTGTYQVNWETFGLRMCDVILFWIPPQAHPMSERRIYAITTRLEMAENLARGHKVIIGVDPECEELAGIHHLKRMAKYYGVNKIHASSMDKLSRMIKPSTSRNETLMERWNQTVAPGDTVFIEGDFGAEEWKPFLNGKIELITK